MIRYSSLGFVPQVTGVERGEDALELIKWVWGVELLVCVCARGGMEEDVDAQNIPCGRGTESTTQRAEEGELWKEERDVLEEKM